MIRSIEEGKTSADIYVDDVYYPSFCFIHENHSLLIGGDGSTQKIYEAVAFFYDTVLTQEDRKRLHIMKVTYPNKRWKETLSKGIEDIQIHDLDRTLFYNLLKGDLSPSDNSYVIRITSELLNNKEIKNIDMIIEEVVSMNGSIEKFLEIGFGYALLIDGEIAGFCTSEYNTKSECGIGIEVLKKHQRQGLATEMIRSFLFEAKERGVTPYWDCWKDNLASKQTAIKNGFTKITDYPVVKIIFNR